MWLLLLLLLAVACCLLLVAGCWLLVAAGCNAHQTIDSQQHAGEAGEKNYRNNAKKSAESDKVAAVAHAHVARLQNHVARQSSGFFSSKCECVCVLALRLI